MDAAIINLQDFAVRTPEQVIRVFFKLYDAGKIKTQLWQHFGNWARTRAKETTIPNEEEAQVALLFDQLIALTEALEKLRNGNTTAISCVVCGNKIGNRGEGEPTEQA